MNGRQPDREWRLLRAAERRLPARIRDEFDANLCAWLILLRRQVRTSHRTTVIRPAGRPPRNRGPR